MSSAQTLVVRTFTDRAEGLSHFVLRAGEAPRLLAFDDALGCPVETALAALEWTGAVGILQDDDLLHAARLTSETAAAVIERKSQDGRRYVYLGPRLDAPPMDVFEGAILFDEPGVKAVEFTQRAHGLAHFLRATAGAGALLALLGRRAPEIRHLRRWLGPIIQQLDFPVRWWRAGLPQGRQAASSRRSKASPTIAISKWGWNRETNGWAAGVDYAGRRATGGADGASFPSSTRLRPGFAARCRSSPPRFSGHR